MPEYDRRDFLKLVGASAGAAAAAGCSDPVEKLIPYVVQPEEITPGIAVHYASTCTECPAGCGLHVKTREGRPIKLEGNPDHPINRGALCARGQAAIGRTYHPDRYQGPVADGAGTSWDKAQARLAQAIQGASGKVGILGGRRGPTVDGVIDAFAAGVGAERVVYEPFDGAALRGAAKAVFGVAATPIFDLSNADLIVDLGSDLIDVGPSPCEHAAQFAAARDIHEHQAGGARVISIGPRLSLTASNADVWIPARPGSEIEVIRAVGAAALAIRGGAGGGAAAQVLSGVDLSTAATAAGVDHGLLEDLAQRLAHAKNPVVMPPGVSLASERATATAAAVLLLNVALGALGRTMSVPRQPDASPPSGLAGVKRLIDAINGGDVALLLIHDANPVYSLPAELGFADALSKVGLVVSFASMRDESSERAGLVLPDHSALESWGDAAPRSGVRSLQQPTVQPLLDTRALGDTLLAAGRAAGVGNLPEGDVRSLVRANWGAGFRQALARGGEFGEDAGSASLAADLSGLSFAAPSLGGSGDLTLVLHPHPYIYDGRGAALPWLQEVPDPVTKAAWRSWAELSDRAAERIGAGFGDVVSIESSADTIELPVYIRGGVRDDVVAVAIGQGHTVGHYASMGGDEGGARGVNVSAILPAATDESGGQAWLATRVTVRSTGGYQRIPLSQWTDNQHERGIAREVSLASLAEGYHEHEHGEHHGVRPYEAKNDAHPDSAYRWGMTLDTDRCNGCSACVAACYIENNVPVVGEEQFLRHREMSWLRIERYIGDGDGEGGEERRLVPNREKLGKVDVRHLPMLCQQCGAAPCEAVCPPIATYHSPEGLNGMIYNRCIGTRYCANACVYTVRRFNYWDYGNDNFPGMLGLMLNPDVTVRQQGVMEKCSFCVQRVAEARQGAKDEGRDIADGEVVTACQQACPTSAISFGNTRDEKSTVNARAHEPKRAYHPLQMLNARSAITYLAQVNREADEGKHG